MIYGNHRDSWVHGAIDPSSGTSVMLELSRVLGVKVKQGELSSEGRPTLIPDGGGLTCVALGGRKMAASQVDHLRKLGR